MWKLFGVKQIALNYCPKQVLLVLCGFFLLKTLKPFLPSDVRCFSLEKSRNDSILTIIFLAIRTFRRATGCREFFMLLLSQQVTKYNYYEVWARFS